MLHCTVPNKLNHVHQHFENLFIFLFPKRKHFNGIKKEKMANLPYSWKTIICGIQCDHLGSYFCQASKNLEHERDAKIY